MDSWNVRRSFSATSIALPSESSKPMYIPSRRPSRNQERRRPNHKQHEGVPPAVAALLAVTAIPPPSRRQRDRKQRKSEGGLTGSATSQETLVWKELKEDAMSFMSEDSQDTARSGLSPLSVLLSPPEIEDDTASMERSSSECLLSSRSVSTESVPSLDTDNESTISIISSSLSSYPTRRRHGSDARARIVSSPPEDCALDHPLMFTVDEDTKTSVTQPETIFPEDTLRRVTGRLNFKSNLTASLRVLKSAARSFTALSSAARPDDYLTRSILSISPTFTDERRPPLCTQEPTAAVRRYFNPWVATYDEAPCTGAIQMQTYSPHSRPPPERPYEDDEPAVQPVEAAALTPGERQRDVRENSDFLRVIVLEMNMRRGGKLSDTAMGKARLVLPPRKSSKLTPRCWEAHVCVYEEY